MKYLNTNTGVFVLLFIISFLIKFVLLKYNNFDGFYGQDSYAYFENSKVFIESLYKFQIPPNFYWPIGFYILTFIFNILTIGNTPLASLLVSITAGSLLPGATYLLSLELTKEYFEKTKAKKISVYAGLIICFSGVMIKSGLVIMSDMPGLLFAVLSIYYFAKFLSDNKNRYILYAISFLSFSILIRYLNILLIILFVIFFFATPHKKEVYNLKIVFLSLLAAFVIFSPQLYYIFKFGISYLRIEEGPGVWVTNWNPLNFFKRDFFTTDGTMNYRFWNLGYYFSFIFHPLYLSLFGLSFFAGLYFCLKNKLKNIILFILPWIFIYIIYLSGNPFQSGRYALNYFPALAIIASIGIFEININILYKNIFIIISLLLLLAYGLYHFNNFAADKNKDLKTIEYLNNNIQGNSLLLSFEITGAVNHYTKLENKDLYYFNAQTINQLIDSSRKDVYMIIPESKIQTQWKGLTLERTYNYIKDNYYLFKISDINYYTIYKINRK